MIDLWGVVGFFWRHFKTCGLRQYFNRFAKVHALIVHDEPEGITARATAEAVIKLLLWVYRKRRRLFFVKRATSGIIFTGFFELYATVDHIDDVGPVKNLVNKRLLESGHIRRPKAVLKP